MTTEEIIRRNKVIAEFMGEEIVINSQGDWRCKHSEGRGLWLDERNLIYNSSWDWLMPVVEKIESLDKKIYAVGILRNSVHIMENGNVVCSDTNDSKIEAIFIAVSDFCEWYNQQNLK